MAGIEFLIHDVRVEAGVTLASGIVNKGGVPIGATFSLVRHFSSEVREVHLSVKKIMAYRHEINELPSGMSGELTLEGRGADHLSKHDMLEA